MEVHVHDSRSSQLRWGTAVSFEANLSYIIRPDPKIIQDSASIVFAICKTTTKHGSSHL